MRRRGPFDRMPFFGRATAKGNVLYLHVVPVAGGWAAAGDGGCGRRLSRRCCWRRGAKLKFAGEVVELPAEAPDATASVLKLTLKGPAKAEPYILAPDQDGRITAGPESCEFRTKPGMIVRRENRDGRVYLSHWTRAIDVPTWKVSVPRDGRYQVEVVYSAAEASRNVLFTITMKGPTMGMVKGTVEPTGGASRRVKVSTMELEAGNHLLYVQPENKAGQPAMELEAVILYRVGD